MQRSFLPSALQLERDLILMISILEVIKQQYITNRDGLEARLIRMLKPEPCSAPDCDGDCMVWQGAVKSSGYGILNFKWSGRHIQIFAHRFFWVLTHKQDIPPGMHIDHMCCNRRCVRHLQLTTPKQNYTYRDERRKIR